MTDFKSNKLSSIATYADLLKESGGGDSGLKPGGIIAVPPGERVVLGENTAAPAGKKMRGGVGVSDSAPASGVAIYSDEAPKKNATASGGTKNPFRGALNCYRCTSRINRQNLTLWHAGLAPQRCQACGKLQPPHLPEPREMEIAAAVKHERSVCDSAQVGKMERRS